MGNLINPQGDQLSKLLYPIDKSLFFLLNWDNTKISQLINRYKLITNSKIQLLHKEFIKLVQKTCIETVSDIIYIRFKNKKAKTINILELFAVIITYSELLLQQKIAYFLAIFNLDGKKSFKKEDLCKICEYFANGIKKACFDPADPTFHLEKYMKYTLIPSDINIDCQVTKEK